MTIPLILEYPKIVIGIGIIGCLIIIWFSREVRKSPLRENCDSCGDEYDPHDMFWESNGEFLCPHCHQAKEIAANVSSRDSC